MQQDGKFSPAEKEGHHGQRNEARTDLEGPGSSEQEQEIVRELVTR